MMLLLIPAASARTTNPKACFGQNTSFAVAEWGGGALKFEAAASDFGPYVNVGAMLQDFRVNLPFGCPGDG